MGLELGFNAVVTLYLIDGVWTLNAAEPRPLRSDPLPSDGRSVAAALAAAAPGVSIRADVPSGERDGAFDATITASSPDSFDPRRSSTRSMALIPRTGTTTRGVVRGQQDLHVQGRRKPRGALLGTRWSTQSNSLRPSLGRSAARAILADLAHRRWYSIETALCRCLSKKLSGAASGRVSDFAVVRVALGVEADVANRRPVADLT